MLIGVRHGQRADLSEDPKEKERVELKFDPPLTKLGEIQAQITGKEMLKKLEIYEEFLVKNGLFQGKIVPVLICSPFLRTIQTAYHIANSLGPIYRETIFIHEEICELLDDNKTYGYEEDPRPKLFSSTRKLEDFRNYEMDFLNGKLKLSKSEIINPEYKEPIYPEKKSECKLRIARFIQHFPRIFFQKFKFNEFALIWVTHLFCIDASCMFLKGTDEKTFPTDNVGFCGILDLRIDDAEGECKKMRVEQWGTNDHLGKMLPEQKF